MLFERSEFIERFEGFIVPASETGRFRTLSFCFGFLSGDRKKMKVSRKATTFSWGEGGE